MNLKQQYIAVCNKYIEKFAELSEMDFDGWVANDVGSIASFGDYFFGFAEIRYLVDNNISFDWLSDWYWLVVENEKIRINFDHYCRIRSEYNYKAGFKEFELKSFEKYLKKLLKK